MLPGSASGVLDILHICITLPPQVHRWPSPPPCLRWVLQRSEDDSGGLLDAFQALGQQGSISVVEADVVGGCVGVLQTDSLANNKSYGLGLRLANDFGRRRLALGLVQHLVPSHAQESKTPQPSTDSAESHPAAVAHAQRRGNALGKDKLDPLMFDERKQTVAVLSHVAADLTDRGQLRAPIPACQGT